MGLQDESIKPGKVQKAFLGKMIKGVGKGMGRIFGRKQSATATPGAATMSGSGKGMGKMLPQLLQKAIDDGVIKPASKGRMMKARTGHFAKSNISKHERVLKPDTTKPISSVAPKVTDALKKKKLPGRIGTALGIGAMMVPAAYAAMKQYKDYKSAKNRDKAKVKKYNKGGEGRLRSAYVYDQTVKNTKAEGKGYSTLKNLKETRREEYGAAKDRYPSKKDKLKGIAKKVGSLAPFMPTVSVAKGVYDKLSQSTVRKYSVGGGADTGTAGERRSRLGVLGNKFKRRSRNEDRLTNKDLEYVKAGLTGAARPIGTSVIKAAKKFRDNYKAEVRDSAKVKKMGGGMMQRPMGYKSGTMVKARGCKLGRTRPTKIT